MKIILEKKSMAPSSPITLLELRFLKETDKENQRILSGKFVYFNLLFSLKKNLLFNNYFNHIFYI